jgi:hypothetical protein
VHERPGGRTYHYKNQFLSWDHEFIREHLHDFETYRVSVFLTYLEPTALAADANLSVQIRAEVFRAGQISHVDGRVEYDVRLDEVQQKGMVEVMQAALSKGDQFLAP